MVARAQWGEMLGSSQNLRQIEDITKALYDAAHGDALQAGGFGGELEASRHRAEATGQLSLARLIASGEPHHGPALECSV